MASTVQLHRINPIKHAAQEPQVKPTRFCPVPADVGAPESVLRRHTHAVAPGQCCSAAVRSIAAPAAAVWSLLRRFGEPQAYKVFVRGCRVVRGDGGVGTVREVTVASGLPAAWSTERLEVLDEEAHAVGFSVVGGEHRLRNYRSVTTLHAAEGGEGTVVVESYVVDVPPGNTAEETCAFVDTIVRCNLESLANVAEKLARN
ncbi:Abscisic acid receptor PYL5 [Striga hermonthica]|uniref:Abscisic acid receptor PYL5 n=1 Tax=Striga hermonthica TaxID=68872 RepID=A0A9N7NQ27_STRHE|nr:Abscisic acid receptor PYL5 [Striga hermonthica]